MTIRPVPGLTIEQQPDNVLLRMCLWAEARGEPLLGILAVAWVIGNRARRRRKTLAYIILEPKQFSWTNADDPNRLKVLDAWRTDPDGWGRVDIVAHLYEDGATTDPTGAALNYYRPINGNHPAWGRGHQGWREHVTIGNHIFGIAA